MDSIFVLERMGFVLIFILVFVVSYFRMGNNPLSKGPRLMMVFSLTAVLLKGVASIAPSPYLGMFIDALSNWLGGCTVVVFILLLFLWRLDDRILRP
jgi:cell shape-determining protein MreD